MHGKTSEQGFRNLQKSFNYGAGPFDTFAAFAQARVTHRWNGFIDVTPGAVPVIGSVAVIPSFHLASGFSGHGFGIGRAPGKLMAELVQGLRPSVDPTPFRLERFTRTAAPRGPQGEERTQPNTRTDT